MRASADMSSSPCPRAINPDSSCAARALTGSAAPELVGQLQGDPEVLAMEGDLEPERIVVVDHPAAPVLQHPALGRSPAERRDHLLDVEAGPDREHDPLRDAQVGAGEDDLVDRLDRLTRADRSDVGDRLDPSQPGSAGLARRRLRRRRRRSSASPSGLPRSRPTRARRSSRCPAHAGAPRSPSCRTARWSSSR